MQEKLGQHNSYKLSNPKNDPHWCHEILKRKKGREIKINTMKP